METFVMIVSALVLLFFIAIGAGSMLICSSPDVYVQEDRLRLEELYEADDNFFVGLLVGGELVKVSGRLQFFEKPFSAERVKKTAAGLDYLIGSFICRHVVCKQDGFWEASVLFEGKDRVLVSCAVPGGNSSVFFALAEKDDVGGSPCGDGKLRVEMTDLVKMREVIINGTAEA